MANAPIVVMDGEDIEYDYDSDGNPIVPEGAKVRRRSCWYYTDHHHHGLSHRLLIRCHQSTIAQ